MRLLNQLYSPNNPLGKIWYAGIFASSAHRLSSSTSQGRSLLTLNLVESIEDIQNKMIYRHLRISGTLLLGCSTIYGKKTTRLLNSSNRLFNDSSKKGNTPEKPGALQLAEDNVSKNKNTYLSKRVTYPRGYGVIPDFAVEIDEDVFFDRPSKHSQLLDKGYVFKDPEYRVFEEDDDDDDNVSYGVVGEEKNGRDDLGKDEEVVEGTEIDFGAEFEDLVNDDVVEDGGDEFGMIGDDDLDELDKDNLKKEGDYGERKRKRGSKTDFLDKDTMISSKVMKNWLNNVSTLGTVVSRPVINVSNTFPGVTFRVGVGKKSVAGTGEVKRDERRIFMGMKNVTEDVHKFFSGLCDPQRFAKRRKIQDDLDVEIGRVEKGRDNTQLEDDENLMEDGGDLFGGFDEDGGNQDNVFEDKFSPIRKMNFEDSKDKVLLSDGHSEFVSHISVNKDYLKSPSLKLENNSKKFLNYMYDKFEEDDEFDSSDDEEKEEMEFDDLLNAKSKTIAALGFYHTLVLASKGYVRVRQRKPFGRIRITKGPKW